MRKTLRTICILLATLLLFSTCAAALDDTRTYTDDFGREVTLPLVVDKVIPSGAIALSVLISFDPDYLASCAKGLPTNAEKYLPELAAKNLPMTGGLFTSVSDMNYEEVLNLVDRGVDVYIDVGQAKKGSAEELDKFTEKSTLASVFVSQNSLEELAPSYQKLGQILGAEKRGNELYLYVKNWIDTIQTGMKKVEKKTACQITSIDGNEISLLGGFNEDKSLGYQGMVINTLADNIVTAKGNKGTGDVYGMEAAMQLLYDKDPDFIFINGEKDHANYKAFMENAAFKDLKAVKNGNVYEIPNYCPYLWTASPFSGLGVCGFIWMANVMYPETFNYDVKEKVKEFYKVMLNYNMTDDEYNELTLYSTPKEQPKTQTKSPCPLFGLLAGFAAAAVVVCRKL
ncbi:MAG TPA: ABC transporter substrate-binding protein [Methanocorpusculum sp.]|nr:ABC transporter substrate-binding protein [Methanocorpusculum sp.]